MNDTPTLDEAIEMASSTLPNEDVEETQTLPESSEVSEPESSKESKEAQPDGEEETSKQSNEAEEEETFTDKKLSYNNLPDELKPIYRDWQKSYTQKRQAEKAELEELRRKVSEMETKPATEQPRLNRQEQVQTQGMTQEQLEHYLDVREQNRYIEAQERDFMALDGRFSEDSPDYDPILFYGISGKLADERDAYEAKNKSVVGFDFVGRAKQLLAEHDKQLTQKTGEFIKQKTEQSKQNLEKSRKENPKATNLAGKTDKVLDLDDAVDLAFSKVSS